MIEYEWEEEWEEGTYNFRLYSPSSLYGYNRAFFKLVN